MFELFVKPFFISVPQRNEYRGEGEVKFTAVVSGVPKPTIKWYKNNMRLDGQTRVVDILGTYTVIADNIHGCVDTTVVVQYGIRPAASVNGSINDSEATLYPVRTHGWKNRNRFFNYFNNFFDLFSILDWI